MEIVTYSSVSENIYMDKKNKPIYCIPGTEVKVSADHRGYQ